MTADCNLMHICGTVVCSIGVYSVSYTHLDVYKRQMKDLIVDALSALTVTIIGYYSIKNKDHNQDCKPVAEIEDEEVV